MTGPTSSHVLPVGPLMIEHRLIERMVVLLAQAVGRQQGHAAMPADLIDAAVDFFQFYADRCHHGKEEEILFKSLLAKPLSPEHRTMTENLISDHVRARSLVTELAENRAEATASARCVRNLVKLYTSHIRKEDKQYFLPVMSYFTEKEQQEMLAKFWAFDRTLLHEKYRLLLDNQEALAAREYRS